MGDGVNFSFNKGNKFNITSSDGVSKEELIQRAGGENTQQGKLISSIFARYDNGDGFLSATEYQQMQADLVRFAKDDNLGGRELKKFNSNLSTEGNAVEGNAYSMEDLQAVISMMVDGEDSVTGVVQEGDNLKVTYKPEEGVGTRTSTFAKGDNNALTLLSDSVVNGDTTTVTEYLDGARDKYRSIKVTNGNSTTTTTYADDGTTISTKTRVTGTVTEEFDPANPDRVTKKTTDKGLGGTETVTYTYGSDGSKTEVYTDTEHGNNPVKKVVTDASGNVTTTKFEYDQEGNVTEITTVGEGEPTVVRKDAQGNVIPDTPPTTTYDVQSGEVWYNIVAAKYNVSDHKTIMNIVHQLKDIAGKNYRTNNADDYIMPSQITLPNEVTVGEQKFTLTADAATNPALVSTVAPTPPTPAADEVVAVDSDSPVEQTSTPDETPAPDTNVPMMMTSLTRPKNRVAIMPTTNEQDNYGRDTLVIDSNNSGYTTFDYGLFFYNSNPVQKVKYNMFGVVQSYTDYEYDQQGNKTREIVRNPAGFLMKYKNSDGI